MRRGQAVRQRQLDTVLRAERQHALVATLDAERCRAGQAQRVHCDNDHRQQVN
jgi:hypothetical protein